MEPHDRRTRARAEGIQGRQRKNENGWQGWHNHALLRSVHRATPCTPQQNAEPLGFADRQIRYPVRAGRYPDLTTTSGQRSR
jgi:hypothetical protein